MAPAEIAAASSRTDSIRGLAQSLANPNYRRLLIAEPLLRRAVPVLIIAFLVTIMIGAVVQVLDHRAQVLADVAKDVEFIVELVAERIDHSTTESARDAPGDAAKLLELALPPRANTTGRSIYLTDASGTIMAQSPTPARADAAKLIDVIGTNQPLTILGAGAGVLEIALADGAQAIGAVRNLKAPFAQVAVIHLRSEALSSWRSDTTLAITLSATTGFMVLILGFAFHWQATRAREADIINDTVRIRVDTALNRGRCGLWDWDLGRGRIFWSRSMFDILGLEPRDELLTFGEVCALAHADDIKLYDLASELTEAQTMSIDRAFRMRHARGEWVWLRVRCELVHQPECPAPHLIGIAVDITEQKGLVEKTLAADLRLRDAIETIPEAFVLWDAENRIVLCNSNFQALHDLPDDAVTCGTPYETVIAAGRKPVIRATAIADNNAVPGARTFEAELENGRWLHISERRTKDGGYVSVGTDITTLKQHEEKLVQGERRLIATIADLRNSQQALEGQAQLLADLAEKYAEEKTRAQDASRAKSSFLANMSHELRTPLNAIIGFSEIMDSGMFGSLGAPKYAEYCRDIRDSGRYLLDFINDILDMSKIEAGRIKLDFEILDLAEILADAMRVVSGRASEKRLDLQLKIASDVRLRADRRALKQIALNLLTNAVKFTPEGGCIRVRGRTRENGLFITIADTGIGIAPAALRRLGRPFEQVESQLTKSHQGSGLGLAIAKSLTELHHGRMRIRSTLGVGTAVMLHLPAYQLAPGAAAVAAAAR
ncbi:MAG: PAS-domain containing protein [Proteobacteria bacterium]|nr:PAS-domain containing protein [Pseudomonadota bacterium]